MVLEPNAKELHVEEEALGACFISEGMICILVICGKIH